MRKAAAKSKTAPARSLLPKSEAIKERLLLAAARYLDDQGWDPLVVSVSRIQSGALKYSYELVLKFTGTPPAPPSGEMQL